MVAIVLESRACIATTASPLTSSFLPKCSHLLQVQPPSRPRTGRPSFHRVAASTKQNKKARSSSSAREWSYEHLMVMWDEVFEQCCTDSVKATKIRDLSYRGLSNHGRGCVLVFQEVQTRPRGSGTGFTSKPPKSSRRVPEFFTLDWYAVYLPREFLLDPRKAPNEAEMEPRDVETSSVDNAIQGAETCKESNNDDAQVVTQCDRGKDVTIDVEDIIRSAQDVYQFGSDDEDELDVPSDDVNLNNDSSLILDDKEDASAVSTIDSESFLVLDQEENGIATAACVSNNVYEAPLLIFDDEPVVTTSPRVEMQSSKEMNADGAALNFANVRSQANFGSEDGATEIAQGTLIKTEKIHGEDHDIDDTGSGKGRSKMQFNVAGRDTASLSATGLDDEVTGKDSGANGAHSKSSLNEAHGYNRELLEESTEVDASSLQVSITNENASMAGQGMQDQGDGQSKNEVELATQQMLFTTMRGMDRTRLMSLTANFDFEAEKFRFGRKMAMIDTKTMDAGGEDPYNAKEDELVLLLHVVIDGRPAYGADVVIAYKDESQIVGFENDAWKLKGKYKI